MTLRRDTRLALEDDPTLFDAVLARMQGAMTEAEDGAARLPSAVEVCREMGLSYGALLIWVNADAGRAHRLMDALSVRAMLMGEELVGIADAPPAPLLDADGKPVLDADGRVVVVRPDTRRDKLRIGTRQWLAERWAPGVFGAKTQVAGTVRVVVDRAGYKELDVTPQQATLPGPVAPATMHATAAMHDEI